MKVLMNIPVVIAVAALSLSIGCTKKRSPKLADGEGRYSQAISQYDGKTFKLVTHEAIGKGGIISSSEEAKSVSDEQSVMKTFPAVRYTTDAKLVDSVAFLAKPNTSNVYEIHYSVTNSHLLVSKVATAEHIPYQERSYAEKLADGRLAVPLFGYPIVAKISREVAKNDLGEKTSRLAERSVMDISEASHIQVDFTRFEEFGAVKKVDTFPVSFFTGDKNDSEWYFGETVLGSPDKDSGMIGDSSTFTLFDVKQSLVRFDRTQNGLEVVGLAVDEKAKDNNANYKRVAFFPGEYKEFKVEKDGRFKKLREEEESSDKVLWKNTQYIKLDFSRLISAYASRRSNGSANEVDLSGLKVVNVKLENDYISIIVENASSNVRLHLSFLKKKKQKNTYEPLVYHNADNKLFGYYATMAPSFEAQDYRSRRESDIEKQFYVNRFNPSKKVIEYYISTSTPDWVIPAAEKSIQTWNDAFQLATNRNIEVRLNKSKKVETGDIRYNVLNLIDAKGIGSGGGLFGYGPVLSDPFTGEVVSATSTIHVHNFRVSMIYDIRGYVLAKAGILPDYYGKGGNSFQEILVNTAHKMKALFASTPDVQDQTLSNSTAHNPFKRDLSQKGKEFPKLSKVTNAEFRKKYVQNMGRESAVPILMDNIETDLKTKCPEVMAYIETIKASNGKELNEIPVIEACADKVLVDAMIPTIVHELGHNFGLRHNYGGSADYSNFYADAKGQPTVNTSSIMDYVPLDYRHLSTPGKYDVAAIRYAYAGQVQLSKDAGNTFVGLNPKMDILKNLEAKSLKPDALKTYKYCSDFEAKAGNTDPMCALFDVGYTPAQVMKFRIQEANQTFALGQYKWDRATTRDLESQYFAFWSSVEPMMKFYGHWREKLAEYMGKKNVYLESYTPESYEKILEDMKKDPQYSKFYAEYKPVVDDLFKFLMNYAFLTDRYCLVENDGTKNLDLIEFNKVRRNVYAQTTTTSIKSCLEEAAKTSLKKQNLTPIAEFGYSSQNIRYDLSDAGQVSAVSRQGVTSDDVISTAAVKKVASQAITRRVTVTLKGSEMGMIPAMIDEPTFRKKWMDTLFDRVIDGINPAKIAEVPELKAVLEKAGLKERFLKSKISSRFTDEKDILDSYLLNTKIGLQIPGSISGSLDRTKAIAGNLVQSGGSPIGNGMMYATGGPEAVYANKVLEKYLANQAFLDMPDDQFTAIVGLVASAGFPQTQEDLKKMKIEEFMAKMQGLQATIKKAVGDDEASTAHIMTTIFTLFPELKDASNDIEKFVAAAQKEISESPEVKGATNEEDQKAKVQIVVKRIMSGDAIKLVSTFKPFDMKTKVEEIKARIAAMKANSDELVAQKDLLLMFMIAY